MTIAPNTYFIVCSLLVFGGMIWTMLLKRRMSQVTQTENEIRILNRKALSSKSELVIIELDCERFLLSHSGERISMLSRLAPSNENDMLQVPFDSVLDDTLVTLDKGNG